jgi:hypothetical protein
VKRDPGDAGPPSSGRRGAYAWRTMPIELASDGERNPDVLCERALKLIRGECIVAEGAALNG